MKCNVCGQPSTTAHSCAGGVPMSNLPPQNLPQIDTHRLIDRLLTLESERNAKDAEIERLQAEVAALRLALEPVDPGRLATLGELTDAEAQRLVDALGSDAGQSLQAEAAEGALARQNACKAAEAPK